VMHSANYVSEDFIRKHNRLGRSFGCPSIPEENHEKVIAMLSDQSCVYIHYPDYQYLSTSQLLNTKNVIFGIAALFSETNQFSTLFVDILVQVEVNEPYQEASL